MPNTSTKIKVARPLTRLNLLDYMGLIISNLGPVTVDRLKNLSNDTLMVLYNIWVTELRPECPWEPASKVVKLKVGDEAEYSELTPRERVKLIRQSACGPSDYFVIQFKDDTELDTFNAAGALVPLPIQGAGEHKG